MSEIKLLPCPFCGGKALECKTKIICKDCTCTVYGANLDKAKKNWNTRKPMERIIERLEEQMPISWKFDYIGGKKDGIVEAIEIVKEEGGMNDNTGSE